jgi:2-dehydro-3-deoxyphosphogalactonate aldolase
MTLLQRFLADMPVVAILRGLSPEEALPAFDTRVDAGIRIIEVPLNSPRPLDSLRRLVAQAGDDVLIGAGTVLTVADLRSVAETGARLMVAPNCEPAVIAEAKAQGLMALPGVATPSEAFAALRAGADALKMFPGEMLPPAVLKAWRAVLPAGTQLLPVGSVNMENMAEYVAAGAAGFGIGSALYKPGIAPPELGARARKLTARCRELFAASGKV